MKFSDSQLLMSLEVSPLPPSSEDSISTPQLPTLSSPLSSTEIPILPNHSSHTSELSNTLTPTTQQLDVVLLNVLKELDLMSKSILPYVSTVTPMLDLSSTPVTEPAHVTQDFILIPPRLSPVSLVLLFTVMSATLLTQPNAGPASLEELTTM